MWHRIRALIVKETLAVMHDKKIRIALVAPPIIQLLVLSHAATLEVKHIPIAIYNQDSGWYSRELIGRLRGAPYFDRLTYVYSGEEVKQAVDTEQAIAALQFQPDFSRRAETGTATVQMIIDGRKSNSGQIVAGYVTAVVQDFNADILKMRGVAAGPQALTVFRAWFNPSLDYVMYNVPCLVAILSMILGLMITGLSVAREREMGTFDQLLVSPLEPWQILVGKAVPALIIGIGETTFIMILAILLFRVPFTGSLLMFYFSMVVFVTAIIGVGLFISSLSHTQQQANLAIFVFMLPTMLLSGYATPVENMVEWLKPVSWLMPLRHFLIIVKGVFLKDMPALEVLGHTWPMAVIAVLTLSAAAWTFSRRLE
ncbi:MAG: ABC transporter permease [Alphaproteobacteria bacterium]|nr:ABC transporter permease [Alphaproteobacteria bacterium]